MKNTGKMAQFAVMFFLLLSWGTPAFASAVSVAAYNTTDNGMITAGDTQIYKAVAVSFTLDQETSVTSISWGAILSAYANSDFSQYHISFTGVLNDYYDNSYYNSSWWSGYSAMEPVTVNFEGNGLSLAAGTYYMVLYASNYTQDITGWYTAETVNNTGGSVGSAWGYMYDSENGTGTWTVLENTNLAFSIEGQTTGTGNTTVPVPGTFLLLGSGLAGLIGVRRKVKKH